MTVKAPTIFQKVVTVGEFKAQASEWVRQVAETDAAVVVMQDGQAAGVLISPSAFDFLMDARFRAAVEEGLSDADAGRVHTDEEVERKTKLRFGPRKK